MQSDGNVILESLITSIHSICCRLSVVLHPFADSLAVYQALTRSSMTLLLSSLTLQTAKCQSAVRIYHSEQLITVLMFCRYAV